MEAASRPNEMVLTAVKKLRASGKFKVAALTNNFQFEDASSDSLQLGKVPPEIVELFDEYIESSLVGLRKPDPRFFEFACKKMNVTPDQAIMIDDIGPNLKAAKQLGMTTIRVVVGKAEEAIEQLEQLVQMPLRDRIEPPPRPGPPPLRGSTVLAFTTDIEGCTVYPPPSTADPATLSAAALTALSIEIPDFEIVDTRQIARVIRDTFPISSSPDPTSSATLIEQLSDETYVTRHRKHEYLEKRLRNREKEYVKHQLYTQRVVGSGGGGDGVFAAATHPRKRIGETVPVVRRSAVVLKSTYILASRSVNGQGDGADGVDEERVVVGSEEGKGRIGKRKRAPMPFGYPMGAMPSKAFERSGPLLELLKELGKA
ncbi:hypothetical protein HKX48_005686 [Thoreauomyces humboldtii]|nr:hypothetical protein HKX48_005686 [Thoreauomyces humboldtii]